MDTIEIRGINGWGHHGVLDQERRDGQQFSVDVVLGLDLAQAGESDDLGDTIDYGEVAQRVHAVVVGEPCALIETVAERIVEACRSIPGFEEVRFMEVAVHKPSAPITVPFEDVVLRIRREFV